MLKSLENGTIPFRNRGWFSRFLLGFLAGAMILNLYFAIGDSFRQEGLWWLVNSTILNLMSTILAYTAGPPLYPNILGGAASMPTTEGD